MDRNHHQSHQRCAFIERNLPQFDQIGKNHPLHLPHKTTFQLSKVFRAWYAFSILTSKCASRQSCVHFLISHLTRWLCTRRFGEPTRPPETTKHWNKHRVSYLFMRLDLLFISPLSSHFFSSDPFSFLTALTPAFPSAIFVPVTSVSYQKHFL